MGCDARAGRLDGGLTREKSAGNPSEGAAAGKCSISHLDLSAQCVDGYNAVEMKPLLHPELRMGEAEVALGSAT